MKYLIVNADDFALTEGVSKGIIEASEFGVVRSTTVLVNSKRFQKDVDLLKENSSLGVGVHLTLTYGQPVSKNASTLVDKQGNFHSYSKLKTITASLSTAEIEDEFTAQIEKLLNAGIKATHLDTHHHLHKIPVIHEIVCSLAAKYKIGIRRTDINCPGVKTTEAFTEKFHNDNATDLGFKMLVKKYEKYESLEIMCHPGYFSSELINSTNYSKKRDIELSVLIRYELQAHLERLGIKLINFGELPG